MPFRNAVAGAVLAGALGASPAGAAAMPSYDHVVLIILENHSTNQIVGSHTKTPALNRLAATYGLATNYYAISHPSEPNYVAMLGGDTFGIADDDAFYCKPGMADWGCAQANESGYVNHTVDAPNLAAQLDAHGIRWKGYFEDIPKPGSLVYRWPSPQTPVAGKPDSLYASKHNGFMTFKSVQVDPRRAEKIVGFDALDRDIAADTLPRFATIVPDQCNDMHGLHGHDVPEDCSGKTSAGLLGRGDRVTAAIVDRIVHMPMWRTRQNNAIVITFDENDDDQADSHPVGCCGAIGDKTITTDGGWIATIVITNHGPRALKDPTLYNHYSLLRTLEDAFGISEHVGHAGDPGIRDMTPLFAVSAR